MTFDAHKNFAYSTVATAPSPSDSGTSLVVTTGDGALFPNPSVDGAFNVTIWPSGVQPTGSLSTTYDQFGTSDENGSGIGGVGAFQEKQAQSFVVTASANLQYIELYLNRSNSPTDDLVVELQSNSSGSPSGTVLKAAPNLAASSIGLSHTTYRFYLVYPLVASTLYWIVVRRTGSGDDTNRINIYGSSDDYASGSPKFYNGTWQAQTNSTDFRFRVGTTTGNAEIARCTARSGDTLTLSRMQESGPARAVIVGDQIANTITAKALTDLETPVTTLVAEAGMVNTAPTADVTIPADYCMVVTEEYAMDDTHELVFSDPSELAVI